MCTSVGGEVMGEACLSRRYDLHTTNCRASHSRRLVRLEGYTRVVGVDTMDERSPRSHRGSRPEPRRAEGASLHRGRLPSNAEKTPDVFSVSVGLHYQYILSGSVTVEYAGILPPSPFSRQGSAATSRRPESNAVNCMLQCLKISFS